MEPSVTRMFLNLESKKQQRIVEAAVDEFAGKGYARASMNVVVERAGISKGALFKYFQSKSGLFTFVYRMAFNQVKDYLRAVRAKTRRGPSSSKSRRSFASELTSSAVTPAWRASTITSGSPEMPLRAGRSFRNSNRSL